MLRLFVNALTVRDKYSLLNEDNLTQPIQMPLPKKAKKIFGSIFSIFQSEIEFWAFWAYVFPKLKKDVLDKCLKSKVSEDTSTSYMANDSTLISLIYHCEGN